MPATTDIDQATVIHIAVKGAGRRRELDVFPQRVNDVTVFFTPADKLRQSCAEKPREVVWIAHGLEGKQKIVIEAKHPGSGFLPKDTYILTAKKRVVHSGPAGDPRSRHGSPWPYSVTWLDGNGDMVKQIDPDVIIKNDP